MPPPPILALICTSTTSKFKKAKPNPLDELHHTPLVPKALDVPFLPFCPPAGNSAA
jgi:hypothetical protein